MSTTSNISSHPVVVAVVTAFISAMPLQSSQAAPGVLPTAPLFLATGVEPNLFFTLDNSGSMTLDTTMRQSRIGGLVIDVNGQINWSPGLERRRSHDIRDLYQARVYKLFPPANAGGPPEWADYWIPRNVDANPMYYDPTKTYLPWPGTNADGSPMYVDADPTSVQADPTSGTRWDLTVGHTYQSGEMGPCKGSCTGKNAPKPLEEEIYFPTYFNWTDTNNNGIVDTTDEYERVEIAPGTPEMQNFANWYQYHRNRYQTARFVAGTTINDAGRVRMGINMLNPDRNTGIPYWEDVASMQDTVKKRQLLQTLYTAKTVGGTPALSAMLRSSVYFAKADGTGPILPQVQGGACQQNFNILMTDGAWDDESPGVGNTDGDNNTEFDGGAYADAWPDTLADIAMKFYETDLRPDLPDRVPTVAGADEADHQHLVNYTVSFASYGSLNPETDDPTAVDFSGWPNPRGPSKTANIPLRVDDTWHAAYNSRGKYYEADGAEALLNSFNDIFLDFSARTTSASAVTVNTSELKANSFVYQARFNSSDWSGDLLAFEIADLDSGRLAADPAWSAGDLLTLRTANGRTEDREIITYDRALAKGVPFTWSDIPDSLKDDLNTDSTGNQDSNGEARLEYMRGVRDNEGAGLNLRERASLLGDIVNSSPVYVGEPNLSWPDTAPFPEGADAYSSFKAAQASREPVTYVGSNDGMLHGFKSNDISPTSTGNGKELFAYLPSMLASSAHNEGLHYLTQSNYQHRYHVDLTPTVSDAFVSLGGEGTAKWRTVLIGALRGGGRGVFALDVTSAASLTEANAQNTAIWEFSDADDPDLGYTYSQPVVALTNAGTWVAIFGNGYNSTGDGKPHLFILNLDKGGDGEWTEGDDYIKIEATGGSLADPNGLASPALADVDGNGTVDRVYAGDLHGQLWAFDLSSTNQGNWDVAHTDGGTPKPLFVTQGGKNGQLTAKPVVASHPSQPDSVGNAPNLMVFFGSGQFLVDGDIDTTDVQRFYGIWDKGDATVSANQLVEQSFDANFTDAKVLTKNPVEYDTSYGWFFELADSGERNTTAPLARGNIIFFNSYVPSSEPCVSDGYGYRYAVDLATGGAPLLSAFDANGDNTVNENDLAKDVYGSLSAVTTIRQDGFLPEPVVLEDLLFTGDEAVKIQALEDISTGRLSWQELTQ